MGNTFSYPYGIPWVSGDFGVIDGLGGSAGPVNMVNQSMKFYPYVIWVPVWAPMLLLTSLILEENN